MNHIRIWNDGNYKKSKSSYFNAYFEGVVFELDRCHWIVLQDGFNCSGYLVDDEEYDRFDMERDEGLLQNITVTYLLTMNL